VCVWGGAWDLEGSVYLWCQKVTEIPRLAPPGQLVTLLLLTLASCGFEGVTKQGGFNVGPTANNHAKFGRRAKREGGGCCCHGQLSLTFS